MERCIGCSLCAAACPADAILVVPAENDPAHPNSPGERYAATYEINMLRCIFCGYCEDACPTNAIVLEHQYELSFYDRKSSIYTKEMLLVPADKGHGEIPPVLEQTAAAAPARPRRSTCKLRFADLRVTELLQRNLQIYESAILVNSESVWNYVVFTITAIVAIIGAVAMLMSRNAVHSALFLLLNFSAIAVLYLLLRAPFLFAVQLIVYAGAIIVLFLFVVMLLGAERAEDERDQLGMAAAGRAGDGPGAAGRGGVCLLLRSGAAMGTAVAGDEDFGAPVKIGEALFTTYLLPFEITSVILLAALIGVVVLHQRDREQ